MIAAGWSGMTAAPARPPATGRSTQPTRSMRPPLPGNLSAKRSMGRSSRATRKTALVPTKAKAGLSGTRSERQAKTAVSATVT